MQNLKLSARRCCLRSTPHTWCPPLVLSCGLACVRKPWKGTNRIVVGDSWFAGLKTLRALKKEHGLYFVGMVKTNTSGFPKKWLQDSCGTTRGDYVSALTEEGDAFAIGHNDKCVKTLIANCSTTLIGKPARKKRHDPKGKRLPDRLIPTPMVENEYYEAMPAVDINNHKRQGGIAVESALRLHGPDAWWRRVFACVLGTSETNAQMAGAAFYSSMYGEMRHKRFAEILAMQLMGYSMEDIDDDDDDDDDGDDAPHRVTMSSGCGASSGVHAIGKFTDLNSGEPLDKGGRAYVKGKDFCKQQKCVYCLRVKNVHKLTSWYCKLCAATAGGPSQAALCVSHDCQCFAEHIALGLPRK